MAGNDSAFLPFVTSVLICYLSLLSKNRSQQLYSAGSLHPCTSFPANQGSLRRQDVTESVTNRQFLNDNELCKYRYTNIGFTNTLNYT